MSKLLKYLIIFIVIIILFILGLFASFKYYMDAPKREIISELQKQGKYPKLDQSKDIKGIVTNDKGIRDDIYKWISQYAEYHHAINGTTWTSSEEDTCE